MALNFYTEVGEDEIADSFGARLERLRTVKQQYDPGNLFRLNQNIKPVGLRTARGELLPEASAARARVDAWPSSRKMRTITSGAPRRSRRAVGGRLGAVRAACSSARS